jgi:hypothetical protein
MLPLEIADPAALNFSEIFGNFYRHLFRVLPRSEFGFLHDVFERFAIEDWPGLIRGQHRYFSAAVRQSSHWVTANEAEVIAHTAGGRIWDLARQGQIGAMFLNVRRGGSRTELQDSAGIVKTTPALLTYKVRHFSLVSELASPAARSFSVTCCILLPS